MTEAEVRQAWYGGRAAMPPAEALARVQRVLTEMLPRRPVRIYEAGGGSVSVLPLEVFGDYTISVVDLDPAQLAANTYADEKILGNVESHSFADRQVDLIVCHNVLEHIEHVDRALERFYESLDGGGLLFVSSPNPRSFFGMITKWTPHWFHVLVYRHILRDREAGRPGHHPFPTVYHPLVAPAALVSFCRGLGFELVYRNEFLGKHFSAVEESRPVLGRLLCQVVGTLDLLTLHRFPLMLGDYHAVLRKPIPSQARAPALDWHPQPKDL